MTAPAQIPEQLPLPLLEAQLDQWVDEFPVHAIRQHLDELHRRKGDLEAAIESLNRRLAVWIAMRSHAEGRDVDSPPSKRDGILNLLERDPHREFRLSEIRAHLTEGGLMQDTAKARHALEMTVVNMTNRGEIERPRKGFYRIARGGDKSPALMNVRSWDGEER
jgi:hypothetical protein